MVSPFNFKLHSLAWLFLLFPAHINAQEEITWDNFLEELSEQEIISDDDNGGEMQREIDYEALTYLFNNKINLNTATREDFEQLPFLNANQIEELCEYIYRYAPLKSMAELYMIESLDYATRQLLERFVCLDTKEETSFPSIRNIAKYGRQQLMATAAVPFYSRKGDKSGYYGYPYKHSLRYQFSYGQYLKAGFVASQDAGEPFFSAHNRGGYDYYSFYLLLRKLGHIKALAVGRYRMKLGMGLILNSNISLGKTITLSSLGRNNNSISGHASLMQTNYMQGAAATVELSKHIDATMFVSYRDIDATLTSDESAIKTILTNGYHRTQTEIERKSNANEFAGGGALTYHGSRVNIGLQGIYNSFSKPLQPDNGQLYRKYYPEGKEFWNISASYAYRGRKASLQGETAMSDNKAIATVNILSMKLTSDLTIMALHRFYSYKYTALHAMGFSTGGHVNNENGAYIAASWQPDKRLSITAYTDFAHFAWARYRTSAASQATDNMLSIVFSDYNRSLSLRYRMKSRQYDNEDKTALDTRTEHRLRLYYTQDIAKWSFKSQIDASLSRMQKNSYGYMASQNICFRNGIYNIMCIASYFHTDDYNSRIYAYERGMSYAMNFPMFYGHGIRYALWAQADITKDLRITAKIATTNYFDRSAIGTALQQINHSHKTDLDLQLKFRF